jgi:hypothetical protein
MAINNFNVGVGTTSQLTRYRYVATGGETSISGADADGKTLSYTVGLEQVYLNGVNLVRGQDYTATNGTSIGNLTALVASDVVEVFAYVPFNIANAVTASTVDAKGDLLVGTAADTVGRLAVGTDAAFLRADSTASSGLKWDNDAWTSYTPTWSNVTIGNATVNFTYKQIGKVVFVRGKATFGSTTSVSGNMQISLPVTANSNMLDLPSGILRTQDAGVDNWYGWVLFIETGKVELIVGRTDSTYFKGAAMNATVPYTFGNGDLIYLSFNYEAA